MKKMLLAALLLCNCGHRQAPLAEGAKGYRLCRNVREGIECSVLRKKEEAEAILKADAIQYPSLASNSWIMPEFDGDVAIKLPSGKLFIVPYEELEERAK